MPAGEGDPWPFAYQAAFALGLAVVAIVLLVALGGGRTATTGGRSGVIEATAGPMVTVARGVTDLAAVPVEPSAPAEPAGGIGGAVATVRASSGAEATAPEDSWAAAGPTASTVATPSGGATATTPTSTARATTPDATAANEAPSTAAEAVGTTTTVAPPATTSTTTAPAINAAGGPVHSPDVEADVVPLTNRDRAGEGLGPLARNGCLDSVASEYAQQMAGNGVLAHNSGAATAVTGCRPGAAWGDNVGTAVPCVASVLEDRWMNSPSHRHNILTADFQYIGVGAWTDAAGSCWVQVLFSS